MGKQPWYDSDNPGTVVRGASWRAGVWIICALLVAAIIGGVWWGVRVATSGVRGAGDTTVQNNSANNRISAQAHFQSLWGDINGYVVKLDQAKADLDAHPGDQFYQTNYTGLINQCADAVAMFNADAAKTLQSQWRNPTLPYQIDARATCKPGITAPVPAS